MTFLIKSLPGKATLAAVATAIFSTAPVAAQTQNLEIAERTDPIIILPPQPAPCPTLRAGDITEERPTHEVKLFFPWWPGIDESSLGDGDLVARGPNDYLQRAKFVSLERLDVSFPLPLSNVPDGIDDLIAIPQPHPIWVATYSFSPPPEVIPAGERNQWTSADNGRYAVSLVEGEITNDDGRPFPPKLLGGFLCIIRDGPPETIQPTETKCEVVRHRLAIAEVITDGTVDAVGYHALVKMCFRTPHVDIDWGRVTRERSTFKVDAKAVRLPLPGPDPRPIPLPLAGALPPLDDGGDGLPTVDPDPSRPDLTPCFRHRFDLGALAAGEYRFVFSVNGEVTCREGFRVPPIPPNDDEPPGARLEVRNITQAHDGPQRMMVTYQDRSGVDLSTLGDGDLVVFNPCLWIADDTLRTHPCDWEAQRARLVEVLSVSTHNREVKAVYEIDPPRGGWSHHHNGFYPVALWEDAVCDRLGNCTPQARLGGFEVAIDPANPPIPARAEVRVDPSNPNRVKAKVHIKFSDYFLVTNQSIRRDGNRIYLLATAAPYAVPAIFPPPPFPEEELSYEIGPLEEGHYAAIFVMNGHIFDAQSFELERQPPVPAEVDLRIDHSDPNNVVAHLSIQFRTPHRVVQGEVEHNGQRILLPAKAEPLPHVFPLDTIRQDGSLDPNLQLPTPPAPPLIELTYRLGALEPGGYLAVFLMNGFPYAAEDFKIADPGPPIPADVRLSVNQDDRSNTVVVAKIHFRTPHVIVSRDLHRRGNHFIFEATAAPIDTLASADANGFSHLPVPQVVTIEYPLGQLEAGQFGGTFVMNGWPYARTEWTVRDPNPFEAEVAIDVEKSDSGDWIANVKIQFNNPNVRISDPGEPAFDGHIIRINAKAAIVIVDPGDPIDPLPVDPNNPAAPGSAPPEDRAIQLRYNLGDLQPGGWWLKYAINGHFEKQHDFFVPPEPPIPARVKLEIDSSADPVLATATIQFEDHYRITAQNVSRIGNTFILDATADGPLPILAPIPPPPVTVDYDLGSLPRGFYHAAFRMNGHFYAAESFSVRDGGFEAEVKLGVELGRPGEDVFLKAVVDIDDPYVIVTDWGTPQIGADGTIKINAKAERVVFIIEPNGDPMEHLYNLGALRPGSYHVSFCLNETPEGHLRFRVPPSCDSPAKVSHIRIAQGNASWFATVGVILARNQEVTDWGVVRQSGHEFHVNVTVECLDFPTPIPFPRPDPFEPIPLDPTDLPAGFNVDANGEIRIGDVPVHIVTHDYNLGILEQGHFSFCVHSLGQTVACSRFLVPGGPPHLELSIGNITAPTDEYRFGITYHDRSGLDHGSIRNADLWIVGNTGHRERAVLLSYASTDDLPSTGASARYAVHGPGGSWDHEDNGRYALVGDPTQIRDLQGNHIENGHLGRFHVRIQPDLEPGVNVTVALNANGEWAATVEILSDPGQQVVINNWDFSCIQFGQSIIKLAEAEIQPTNGPVEPVAHVYNLSSLQPGYYVFVFKTNLAHCGSAGFTVPGAEGDPIDNWQVRVGAAHQADESDDDGDGLNVVGEYFFATDPTRADRPDIRPEIVTDERGVRHLGLRYRRLHGAEGVLRVVEASRNLKDWTDVSEVIDLVEQDVNLDGTIRVLICLRDRLSDSPYRYLRIRAIRDRN